MVLRGKRLFQGDVDALLAAALEADGYYRIQLQHCACRRIAVTPPRIAVVTGASRGLGVETCRQLLEKGLQVILIAREIDHVERGLVALDRPGSIDGHPLNVADETSVNAFMAWLINKHERIDVLVNNAGRLYQHPERNEYEITPQEIVEAIDNNALGAWRMIRQALPHMQRNRYGRIVNVSSGMGALSEMGSGAV